LRANENKLATDEEYNNKAKRHWSQNALHGRHPYEYMSNGSVSRKEGFLAAIQDQVILTRNYKKYILKQRNADEL